MLNAFTLFGRTEGALRGRWGMENSLGEPRLLLPRLQSFYDRVIPFSWLIVRFAVGFDLAHSLSQVRSIHLIRPAVAELRR